MGWFKRHWVWFTLLALFLLLVWNVGSMAVRTSKALAFGLAAGLAALVLLGLAPFGLFAWLTVAWVANFAFGLSGVMLLPASLYDWIPRRTSVTDLSVHGP